MRVECVVDPFDAAALRIVYRSDNRNHIKSNDAFIQESDAGQPGRGGANEVRAFAAADTCKRGPEAIVFARADLDKYDGGQLLSTCSLAADQINFASSRMYVSSHARQVLNQERALNDVLGQIAESAPVSVHDRLAFTLVDPTAPGLASHASTSTAEAESLRSDGPQVRIPSIRQAETKAHADVSH